MDLIDRQRQALLMGKTFRMFALILPDAIKDLHQGHQTANTGDTTFKRLSKQHGDTLRPWFVIA